MPDANSDSTKKSPAGAPAAAKAGAAKPAVPGSAAKPAAATGARPAAPGEAPAPSAQPTATAAASTAAPGGAEENPLHRKLRLRSEDTGLVIAPPRDDDNPLSPLPNSFLVLSQAAELGEHAGPFTYIQVFARDRADLVGSFSLLVEKLAPGGSLWVSWLKPSSKLKGGGQPGDLNENVIRRIGLTHGLVDVNLAVLDRDWSALRLVRRKH
jgi:hypothetical protein